MLLNITFWTNLSAVETEHLVLMEHKLFPDDSEPVFYRVQPSNSITKMIKEESVVTFEMLVLQVSLRQMNQTRFYIVENRNQALQVRLLIGGLPPLLTKEGYVQLIEEHLTIKSESQLTSPQTTLPKHSLLNTQSLRLSAPQRWFSDEHPDLTSSSLYKWGGN